MGICSPLMRSRTFKEPSHIAYHGWKQETTEHQELLPQLEFLYGMDCFELRSGSIVMLQIGSARFKPNGCLCYNFPSHGFSKWHNPFPVKKKGSVVLSSCWAAILWASDMAASMSDHLIWETL